MLSGSEMKGVSGSLGNVAAAVEFAVAVYDKFVGNAYSKKDMRKLELLKNLYKASLEVDDSPLEWKLDDKNRPQNAAKYEDWPTYLKQLRRGRHLVGNYYCQSTLITEYAITYLNSRKKRWIGKGSPGDILELFIAEWINFALNELPTLGCDEISIKKIQQRLNYIEQFKKHEVLFRFGSVNRKKNKSDLIESIQKQLKSCLKLAEQESLLRCARDELDVCKRNIAVLLQSCANVLYYARNTDVTDEPLEISEFVSRDQLNTKAARLIYPKVRETHTGRMLYEMIILAGVKSFGLADEEIERPNEFIYFTEEYKPKAFNIKDRKSDMPKWVKKKDIDQELKIFQNFSVYVLRNSQLKTLVGDTYDLSGKIGDLWAYGSEKGKKSVELLLLSLERELDELKRIFDAFYQRHNQDRQADNSKRKVDPHKEANPNFNKVDTEKLAIEKYCAALQSTIKAIRNQMDRFPTNAKKLIGQQKSKFYRDISYYLQKFHPDLYEKYAFLEKESNEKSDQEIESRKFKYYMEYLNKKSPKLKTNTTLHEKYKDLLKQCQNPYSMEVVNKSADELYDEINNLRKKTENERPAWRFKWGIFPITMGWPFYRSEHRFAMGLLKELDIVFRDVHQFIEVAHRMVAQNLNNLNKADRLALSSVKSDATRMEMNVTLAHINNELSQSKEKEKTLHKAEEIANQWLDKIKDNSLTFTKKEDALNMLKDLLYYKDMLSPHLAHEFIESCDLVKDFIELESEIELPMQLAMSIIDAIKTEPNTKQREEIEIGIIRKARALFEKREPHLSLSGYQQFGLLGESSDEKRINRKSSKSHCSIRYQKGRQETL